MRIMFSHCSQKQLMGKIRPHNGFHERYSRVIPHLHPTSEKHSHVSVEQAKVSGHWVALACERRELTSVLTLGVWARVVFSERETKDEQSARRLTSLLNCLKYTVAARNHQVKMLGEGGHKSDIRILFSPLSEPVLCGAHLALPIRSCFIHVTLHTGSSSRRVFPRQTLRKLERSVFCICQMLFFFFSGGRVWAVWWFRIWGRETLRS